MREHAIITEGVGKLPSGMIVVVYKNGTVAINKGDHTLVIKSHTGLLKVNIEKQEVYECMS